MTEQWFFATLNVSSLVEFGTINLSTDVDCVICTAGLMQENLRLGEEVRSMKKRMDQERGEFHTEIRRLESTAEELQGQLEHAAEEHRAVVEDYCQKIDALEKQLKSDKQFIEVL